MVRKAELKDIVSITKIYNYAVLNTVATFDIIPKTIEDQMNWFHAHDKDHPIFVMEQKEQVVGWASLSSLYDRKAYSTSMEMAIYIDKAYQSQGIGKKLMAAIIDFAKENKTCHTIISRITADNDASIKLHERFGFTKVGTMKEIGYKFDRFIDVHFYQLLFIAH